MGQVINLSAKDEVIVKQIGDACKQVGFFQICGHGVDEEMTQRVIENAATFFNISQVVARSSV